MARRRLYVFSPVDVFGRPFGGSLDVIERLKWSVEWYDRVIVFCPGETNAVLRRHLGDRRLLAVYGAKRLSVVVALFASAAMAWKPIFRLPRRRLQDEGATFLYEGFLSLCMLPQIFAGHAVKGRQKIRVHNDEALFHLDRAEAESNTLLKWALRFEAVRLWSLERIFYSLSRIDRCFISRAEASKFGTRLSDATVPYAPPVIAEDRLREQAQRKPSIVTVANFGLADNRRAIQEFLRDHLARLRERGFSVVIGGFGSESFRRRYGAEPGIEIHGAINADKERELYSQALCCLVASNNRAGYKTRISTALSNRLIPVLHGRGAEANAPDALFAVKSKDLEGMIDDGSLTLLSSKVNGGQYDCLVAGARTSYKKFLLAK